MLRIVHSTGDNAPVDQCGRFVRLVMLGSGGWKALSSLVNAAVGEGFTADAARAGIEKEVALGNLRYQVYMGDDSTGPFATIELVLAKDKPLTPIRRKDDDE